MKSQFEEGFTCLDCGQEGECWVLIKYSLDWFGDQDETFCPECHGDNLEFHKPREDYD